MPTRHHDRPTRSRVVRCADRRCHRHLLRTVHGSLPGGARTVRPSRSARAEGTGRTGCVPVRVPFHGIHPRFLAEDTDVHLHDQQLWYDECLFQSPVRAYRYPANPSVQSAATSITYSPATYAIAI